MLGIGCGVIFLLAAVAAIVACWRSGKGGRRAQKYVQNVNQLTGMHSDFIDRNIHFAPPETLHLSFDMNRSITTNITVPKVMVRQMTFKNDKILKLPTLKELRIRAFLYSYNNNIAFLTHTCCSHCLDMIIHISYFCFYTLMVLWFLYVM